MAANFLLSPVAYKMLNDSRNDVTSIVCWCVRYRSLYSVLCREVTLGITFATEGTREVIELAYTLMLLRVIR